MTNRIDYLIFDLDGTLVDSAPDIADALNHTLGRIGRDPIPVSVVRGFVGAGLQTTLRRGLVATGGVPLGGRRALRRVSHRLCRWGERAAHAPIPVSPRPWPGCWAKAGVWRFAPTK